jgi:YfiH family protein
MFLMLRFADCVPILLLDPKRRAIGIVHAGWRGTLAKIAARTVVAMRNAYGSQPRDICAAIGPSIGPCCFEVGPEVVAAAQHAFRHLSKDEMAGLISRLQPTGQAQLDLWLANTMQLRALGVRHTELAQVCTKCQSEAYYSHRATGGRTGRFAALIGLKDD